MQGVIVEIDGDTATVDLIQPGLVGVVAGKLVAAAGDWVRSVHVLTDGAGPRFRAPLAVVQAAGLTAVPAAKAETRKPRATARRRTAAEVDGGGSGAE